MSEPLSRRAALGAIASASAPALAMPAALIAAATIHPDQALFDLLSAGKHWWEQIGVYCILCDSVNASRDGREVLPEREERLREAHASYEAAFDAAMAIIPQTAAGVRAKLEFAKFDCAGFFTSLSDAQIGALVNSLLASPVLREGSDERVAPAGRSNRA